MVCVFVLALELFFCTHLPSYFVMQIHLVSFKNVKIFLTRVEWYEF